MATIGPVVVALPASLEAKLRPLIGERIGLLRAENDFRLRSYSAAKIANAAEGALKAVMNEV